MITKIQRARTGRPPNRGSVYLSDAGLIAMQKAVYYIGGDGALARAIGRHNSHISMLLSRQRRMTVEVAKSIEDATNGLITVDSLLTVAKTANSLPKVFQSITSNSVQACKLADTQTFIFELVSGLQHYLMYKKLRNKRDAMILSSVFMVNPEIFDDEKFYSE